MSCHKPLAIRICTKKKEIQDISIISNSQGNSFIKVLNLSSLTSAIIRSGSDGRLDQKYILFFDNFFGEAPITFTKFFYPTPTSASASLVLGFSDGSLVIFKKCPSKSLLLETYERIPSTLTSSPIITAFLPFLTVHKNGNCYEFVNLKDKTILTIPELKEFLFIEEKLKIILVKIDGNVTVYNMNNKSQKTLTNILVTSNCIQLLNCNNNWIILSIENRILIINIEKEEIMSSFSIQYDITNLNLISSNTQDIELLTLTRNNTRSNNTNNTRSNITSSITNNTLNNTWNNTTNNTRSNTTNNTSCQLLKLKINPIGNCLEIEKIYETFSDIFGLFVNEIFYILVTIDGIFVHDILTYRLINKCTYPKYFLKYDNEEHIDNYPFHSHTVKISKLDGNKFLFIWGKSLAQIWDFSPKISSSLKQSKTISNSDKGILGNKSIRKYSKYAVNSGFEDYKDEKMEEDHLNHLRSCLNIEGLTEEELISYAKLISQQQEGQSEGGDDNNHIIDNDHIIDNNSPNNASSYDPELEMVLKLSLLEM